MDYYIKSSKICFENEIKPAVLHIQNGNFKEILDYNSNVDSTNYENTLIIPGLFDTHTHGYAGYSFTSSSNKEDIIEVLKLYAKAGVTSIFASSSVSGYASIIDASKEETATKIVGIHAEGPFLNDKKFGIAIPGTKFLKPSLEKTRELIERSNGLLKVMTIAPENEGAVEVMKYLKENFIKVAVGHTNASAKEFRENQKYYDVITHLGNAMSGIHHRNMGVLGAALLSKLSCELIADGLHIGKDMLDIMFRLKPLEEFVLISDSIPLSGLDSKNYQLAHSKVFVKKDGFIINEFGHITGSSKTLLYSIKTLYHLFDFPLYKIIALASIQPAKVYGFDQEFGSIATGKHADFVIIDDQFQVLETYRLGKKVYSRQFDETHKNPKLNDILLDKDFLAFYR